MGTGSPLESVLKRDRLVVMIGLALVVVVAAAYTLAGVGMNMSPLTMTRMAIEMPGMAMQPVGWSAGYAFVIFLMWCVMMVAMMVPSAAPMVLIHAAIGRKQENADRTLAATAIFVAGYLTVWTVFSLVATALQWGLESLGIVTGMMEIASPVIAGLVLITAGLYEHRVVDVAPGRPEDHVDERVAVPGLVEPVFRGPCSPQAGPLEGFQRAICVVRPDHEVEVVRGLGPSARPRSKPATEQERHVRLAQDRGDSLQRFQELVEIGH